MTNEQVEIVKRTFARIVPQRPEGTSEMVLQRYAKILHEANKKFADPFYERFFEKCPEAKELFKNDLEETKQKFMNQLSIYLRSMNRLHDTLNSMQYAGCDHMKVGVKIEHYQPFLSAFLYTLKDVLGEEDFNELVAQAWIAVLSRICGIMANAAYPEERNKAAAELAAKEEAAAAAARQQQSH
jgi:hemoglobin-like flavoprotein